MSKQTILPDDLSSTINDLLTEYGDEASQAIGEIIPDVAKEATKRLKSANSYNRRTGRYNKGWSTSKEAKAIVHNKTDYQLTHLLEFGHAKANGGRTKAFQHIAIVNDWTQEELVERIKERIGK